MKKVKGIAAFAAAVMALNSATIVLAAGPFDGSAQGIGSFEGNIGLNADVYQIEVPTLAEETSLAFILDPNDLIKKTSAARLNGSSFDYANSQGLYFKNSTSAYEYSGKSDELKATNMGTSDVKIAVKATFSDVDGITFIDKTEAEYQTDDTFDWAKVKTEKVAAIYMTLNDKETIPNSEAVDNTDKDAQLNYTINGADVVEGTDISWTEEDGYKYDDGSITPVDYYFYLKGEAGGDWSNIGSNFAPQLDLVWNFKQIVPDALPSVENTDVTLSSTEDTPITLNYGAGDTEATGLTSLTITSTAWATFDNKQLTWLETNNYVTFDAESGILTFKPAFANQLKGRDGATSATIVFNNANATQATINFTIS